jgi:hypothetical protein
LGDIAELIRKDISQSGDYDIPSFIPLEEMPSPEILRDERPGNFPRVPNKVPFETNFNEEESEDLTDFVRVTDDR